MFRILQFVQKEKKEKKSSVKIKKRKNLKRKKYYTFFEQLSNNHAMNCIMHKSI